MPEGKGHISVLLQEVLALLSPSRGGKYLDCTFGGGGHTTAILNAEENARVIALDRDPLAEERAKSLQSKYGGRLKFYDTNFGNLASVPDKYFQGILFDLGVSSFQLDNHERGFSFKREGPNDMRMDPRKGISAAEFLEKAFREDLVKAVRDYGEERSWRKVVDAIIDARGTGKLSTTKAFADLILEIVGRPRGKNIHPATKTFQGIRIAVNQELVEIEQALPVAMEKLEEGGVLVVISFHSLEDRIIKRFFNRMAGRPEHRRESMPQDMRVRQAVLLTKKPVVPSDDEMSVNPRSRSAKLRAIKKECV